jgi:isopenicillin N synthase-like dioxygenase
MPSTMDYIPIIDFSIHNKPGGQEELGKQVAHVLKTSGFMYVKNHGIPQETIDAVFKTSKEVFALPYEVKSKKPRSSKFEPSCGYVPMGSEKLDVVGREEIREAYNYIPFNDERLPDEVADFGPTCKALFNESWQFSKKLLECLAGGLHLENTKVFSEDSHQFIGRPGNFTTLRIHNYPAKSITEKQAENLTRCGAHTDYGTLTVLFQDDVGGLQVETTEGVFVPAVPIPGTVVINIGDIMQRWTSDELRSTVHAVTFGGNNQKGKDRQSIAFFLHPDDDYMVNFLNGSDKYPPISGKEYLRERMYASFTKYFGQND